MRSTSTELLLTALSKSHKGRQRLCCGYKKSTLVAGVYGLLSICSFICFRQWLDLGDASRHCILTFLKWHWSAWQRRKLQVRIKSCDKQNVDIARMKRSGASSYTCFTDSPPGTSLCTILNFPPVGLFWKHFSSLRAYSFIDCPKGVGWGIIHWEWQIFITALCSIFWEYCIFWHWC